MRLLRTLALAGLIAVPLCAAAQQGAYTTTGVNVRAGPDPSYPLVARLSGGTPVTVGGCLQSYTWCDVYTGDVRGWVYASYLAYPYQSSQVPIYSFGPALGLPIISFSIGPYWDNYYRGRPFYSNRNYWYGRPYHAPAPRFPSNWHAPPPPRGPSHYYPQQSNGNYHHDGEGNRPPSYGGNRPPPHVEQPRESNRPPQGRPEGSRPDGTYRTTPGTRNNAAGGEAGG